MRRQYCALTTTIAVLISLFLLTNGASSTRTRSRSQLQIPTTEVNGTHRESQSVREQKINSSVCRLKVLPSLRILPYRSLCPLPLSLILLVCRHSVASPVLKQRKAKSCSLEHAVSVDSTKRFPHPTPSQGLPQPRMTHHAAYGETCAPVCVQVPVCEHAVDKHFRLSYKSRLQQEL